MVVVPGGEGDMRLFGCCSVGKERRWERGGGSHWQLEGLAVGACWSYVARVRREREFERKGINS